MLGERARPAGHLSDADVTCYSGTDAAGKTWEGCDYRLNGSKGWHLMRVTTVHSVNGGIATWTLLNAYEHHPDYFMTARRTFPKAATASLMCWMKRVGRWSFYAGDKCQQANR
ncbi:MAG: hypothetical protein U0528_05345 [Anaerolineae bacterium]